MPENKIPLCVFIGGNLLGISILAFALAANVFELSRHYMNDEDLLGVGMIFLVGSTCLLTGLGFIMRKKWARTVTNIILLICLVLFGFLVYSFVLTFYDERYLGQKVYEQLAAIIFILCTISGLGLFLNNTRVTDELGEKEQI